MNNKKGNKSGLNRPTFTTSQHPWTNRIPLDQIHDMLCFTIPTDIFRSNAKGWQHVRGDRTESGYVHLAGMEFLGNMLKYAKDLGTPGITGYEYTYTRRDPRRPGAMVTTPKVIFLVTLIVKQVVKNVIGKESGVLLPEHRLFSPDNQLSILATVISLDPNLKLIDMIRMMVRENTGYLSEDMRPFAQDDAMRKIDGCDKYADRMEEKASTKEDEEEEEATEDGGGDAAKKKKKTRGSERSARRTRVSEQHPISDLYKKMFTLKKALAVLTDTQFWNDASRELVSTRSLYGTRAALDDSIDNELDPDVVPKMALSLEKVLRGVASRLEGIVGADQLNPETYLWHAPAEEGGDAFFRVPYPDLTWEFDASQATAEQIASSEFPWYASDLLRTYASIVASRYNLSIDAVIEGMTSQKISDEVMTSIIEQDPEDPSTSSSTRTQPCGSEAMRLLGIAPAPQKKKCSPDSLSVDDDGSQSSDVIEMMSEIREMGSYTQGAIRYVNILAAAQLNSAGVEPTTKDVRMMDDEADGSESTKKRTMEDDLGPSVDKIKIDRRDAIGEIREVAAREFGNLVDVSARIPKSVKACAKMIKCGCSVDLPFTVHSKDMGVFSNVVTEIVLLFKYMRIATNNIPLLKLMMSRDSIFMSGITGTLASHPHLSGAYAGGKSYVWEALEKCSLPWHVEYIMGSSPKGVLPVYGNSDICPPDGVLIGFDELPPWLTDSNTRLSSSEREVQGTMSSVMTSYRRPFRYRINMKDPETGRISTYTMLLHAVVGIAGSTNQPFNMNAPGARMDPVLLAPSQIDTTRNAANFVCAQHSCDISEGVVSESLRRLDLLCTLSSNAMYARALPPPNDELLLVHMSVAIEYLQRTRPDVVKKIRTLETAITIANVTAVWTACACVRSAQFGESRGKPFSASDIAAIAPYDNIGYDITFFVIAMAIHNATNPISHKILRWLAEGVGRYPFVSSLKSKVHSVSRGHRFRTTTGSREPGTRMSEEDAEIETEVLTCDTSSMSDSEWIGRFGDLIFEGFPVASIRTSKEPVEVTGRTSKSRGASTRRQRSKFQEAAGVLCPKSTEELTEIFDGASVQFPMGESVGAAAKRNTDQVACDIQTARLKPNKIYAYKYESVDGVLYANPNYVSVLGIPDRLACLFVQKHPNSKLSQDNVQAEMASLFEGRLMRAHVLPLVKADGVDEGRFNDTMVLVEQYRADLWSDPRCVFESIPIVVPNQVGAYVLIEALLDSPKNLVRSVLDYLCCSGTPTCRMAMPFSKGNGTAHILSTYDAVTVPGRTLKCSNPIYTHEAEGPMLAAPIASALSLRRFKGEEISWDETSELGSIRAYFEEHGIRADPKAYTTEAIRARIINRFGPSRTGTVDAMAKEVAEFDKNARARQSSCDDNFARSKATSEKVPEVREAIPRRKFVAANRKKTTSIVASTRMSMASVV